MNPKKRVFWRKVSYGVAIAVLLALIALVGRPAVNTTEKAQGSPGGILAQRREEHDLSQIQFGEIDPTSETIKLACLGMRGVAANILWEKAHRYKMKKDWTNLSATLEQITKVQPNFISVWRFQGWNLSYNVSVEFEDFRERYHWVIRGIEYLKKGARYNRREPRLLRDIGFYISNKIGRADEYRQFRRLFREDDVFNKNRAVADRDNWLVGKEWYIKACELWDSLETSSKGMNPLIFRSDPAKCQMSYAEALEEDGTFGEKAQLAWRTASQEWKEYGSIAFSTGEIDPTTREPIEIHLNDQEMFEENARKLIEQIDALKPGLREELVEKKRAELTDEQRQALDTPQQQRTPDQLSLAAEAEELIEVDFTEVVRGIAGSDRRQAVKLAVEATKNERLAKLVSRYRHIVNFDFWRLRAEMEQDDLTLSARKLIYEGNQAFGEGDLPTARRKFDEGFATWRKALDKFPEMLPNPIFGSEMMDVIKRYRYVLGQLDEEFPKGFVLQDVIDEHKEP